jgi:hypothetical protein
MESPRLGAVAYGLQAGAVGMNRVCLGPCLALVITLLAAPAARAAVSPEGWLIQQSALCNPAIHAAEQRYHLPTGLLAAMARAESGRPITSMNDIRPWPWTIDADGEGLFLDSKTAAVAWMSLQGSRHKYVDVGCLQVDLKLHPRAFASLEQAFDPRANADYAARYLSGLYRNEAARNWNIAVGLYHSHLPSLAAAYRDQVAMLGERILRGVLAPVPLFVRAIRQGTLYVPSGRGKSTPIDVDRQPARTRRRLSACEIARILGPYLNGSAKRCAR